MLDDDLREKLIRFAMEARQWAYAPYSNYTVGAALLADSGKIYTGVNVENAAYSGTVCAERVAVFSAVAEGERSFRAIAVVTENGGSPCGPCRLVLAEFGLGTVVIISDSDGKVVEQISIGELLPMAFTPSDLENPAAS